LPKGYFEIQFPTSELGTVPVSIPLDFQNFESRFRRFYKILRFANFRGNHPIKNYEVVRRHRGINLNKLRLDIRPSLHVHQTHGTRHGIRGSIPNEKS